MAFFSQKHFDQNAQNNQRLAYRIILFSSLVSQFFAGMLWSGLPDFAARLTDDPKLYGILFTITSLAGIVSPILGGYVSARIRNPTVIFITATLTSLCYVALYFSDFSSARTVAFIVLFLSAMIGGIGAPAFSDLLGRIQKKSHSDDLERGSADYESFVMIAKLVGFALGPLAFDYVGLSLVLFMAAGYLVEGVSVLYIGRILYPPTSNPSTAVPTQQQFKSLLLLRSYGKEALVALSTGLLSMPLIALALGVLSVRMSATPLIVSLFWLCTSTVSIASNRFVADGGIARVGRSNLIWISTAAILSAVALTLLSSTAYFLIASFCLFTAGNPVIGAISRNILFHSASDENRRFVFGWLQSFTALGIASGVFILNRVDAVTNHSTWPVLFVLVAIIGSVRALLLQRMQSRLPRQ